MRTVSQPPKRYDASVCNTSGPVKPFRQDEHIAGSNGNAIKPTMKKAVVSSHSRQQPIQAIYLYRSASDMMMSW